MQANYHKLSREILVELVNHGTVTDKCGAICEIVNRRCNHGMALSHDAEQAIENLKNDKTVFWNTFTVGDFATAAEHLLKRIPYTGSRKEVYSLIEVGMDFS